MKDWDKGNTHNQVPEQYRAKILKEFMAFIDQANGLPAGTTDVDGMSYEEIRQAAAEMARTVTIMQWGIIGCIGILIMEGQVIDRFLNNYMPYYDFPWRSYNTTMEDTQRMIIDGAKPDITMQPEVVHSIWYKRGRKIDLPPEEKLQVWHQARNGRIHTTKVREIVKWLEGAKVAKPADQHEPVAQMIEAARRRALAQGVTSGADSDMAGGNDEETGPEPGGSD